MGGKGVCCLGGVNTYGVLMVVGSKWVRALLAWLREVLYRLRASHGDDQAWKDNERRQCRNFFAAEYGVIFDSVVYSQPSRQYRFGSQC